MSQEDQKYHTEISDDISAYIGIERLVIRFNDHHEVLKPREAINLAKFIIQIVPVLKEMEERFKID